ncbi:MAG: hydantoinase B/oxoprolinase family protein, partial [Actinomycetes bacterium]
MRRESGGPRIDPITREVVANSLASAAEEMSRALRRSAYSAIIYDMLDYSCALFGRNGELISQAKNLPAQLGVMSSAIAFMLRKFPAEETHPGDVFIMNHPYFGATHTNDVIVFAPIYYRDRLMGYAGTNAHHMDVGGKTPATEAADAVEIWQEGLLLPIVKLYERGTPNQALLDVIEANVRIPKETLGDVRSQIAACRTGERRWIELCERHGVDALERYVEDLWSYSEAMIRGEIGAMRNGTYRAEDYMDPDLYGTDPVKIVVTVTVSDEAIHADFTGTGPQVRGSMNCPLSSTVSAIWYAVRCMIDADVPMNEGCYRPISWTVPEGCLLNPTPPAAVSIRHLASLRAADVVLKALCEAKPERSAAGCSVSFPTFGAAGVDPRTDEPYICADIIGGGMGGHGHGDGLSAIDTHLGNCAMMFAEALELEAPLRVLKTELVPDSGGAGKHRGGLAVERWYEVDSPGMTIAGWYADQTLDETRPWGVHGGGRGQRAAVIFNPGRDDERELPGRGVNFQTKLGDALSMRGAGGGGWGRPEDRDAYHALFRNQQIHKTYHAVAPY